MAPAPLSSNECAAVAAYYFPVTQYVTSHLGMVETGVGHLEDIILSEGDLLGHTGADDELQVHNEAEAEGGDPATQPWLGRKYFWGLGGLGPDIRTARR